MAAEIYHALHFATKICYATENAESSWIIKNNNNNIIIES
jgi:hypothetical protein